MDLRVVSPYTRKENVYKGQLHCHTTESDGHSTPSEVTEFYYNHGYDFLSITDHRLITEVTPEQDILFINGTEWNFSNDVDKIHLISTNAHVPYGVGIRWITREQTGISVAKNSGAFVYIPHPGRANTHSPAELAEFHDYHAMAIRGYEDDEYESIIDYVLTAGRKIWLIAEDDTHWYNVSWAGTAGVHVFANELTQDSILESLFAGNFYSADANIRLSFSVDGTTISVESDVTGTIQFIGNGGEVLQEEEHVSESSYTVLSEGYVRIKVKEDTEDETLNSAWSNPFWVVDDSRKTVSRIYTERKERILS